MNLGQILLIVLALALLATLQLTIHSSILRESLVTMDNEAKIDAISIAQAMIDEINSKSFDSSTANKVVHFTNELTPQNRFGPEGTESTVPALDQEPFKSQTVFNDVDDYHRYTRLDHSSTLGAFRVRDSIIYVTATNQDLYSASPTWYKKIFVIVKHPNLIDSIVVSSSSRTAPKRVSYVGDSIMVKSLSVYREYF
ncbi:MAG: hypothetical protein HZB59_02490 [Ignavibacteriales bacterium]|nr:hypothetical protein [Ignavibacteriales bacterium]